MVFSSGGCRGGSERLVACRGCGVDFVIVLISGEAEVAVLGDGCGREDCGECRRSR